MQQCVGDASDCATAGVMNYLTGTHAVSLFPKMTYTFRATFTCRDMTKQAHREKEWMEKYRARGFDIVLAGDPLPHVEEIRAWQRRIGDSFTWVMPYQRDTEGATIRPSWELSITDAWITLADSPLDPVYTLGVSRYAFEVLNVNHQVVPAGAALRIGPRFHYRRVSFVLDAAHHIDVIFSAPWLM